LKPARENRQVRLRRRHALPVAALWAAALLAYSNSFHAGFVNDNSMLILHDSRIQAVTAQNIHLIWGQEYWYGNAVSGLYRPLSTFSYLLNYAILGNGPEPAGYHWVNFGLHAVNIALVYFLAWRLLRDGAMALAVGAVWALHPVLTESVTNIIGRSDLLAGFGVLAGLLCHIMGAGASGRRKVAWLGALTAATAIGLFSKESAIVVVAAMLLYDFTFGTLETWRPRSIGYSYAAVALPAAVFFYLRHQTLSRLPIAHFPPTDNPLVAADFWTARLTAVKVTGKYLWLLVWPRHLSIDYSYNQIPLFGWRLSNWEDAKTLIAVAVCGGLAAIAIRSYRSNQPVFFFIALFFAVLAPTSNLVIPIGTIMAERFLYLPSICFAACLVMAIYAICRRLGVVFRWHAHSGWAGPAVLAVICTGLGVRTYARNLDWVDQQSIWTSAAAVSPASFKTHMNLAYSLTGPVPDRIDRILVEMDSALGIVDSLPDEQNSARVYETAGAWYRRKGDLLSPAPPGVSSENQAWYRKSLSVLLRGARVDAAYIQATRRRDLAGGRQPTAAGWYPVYLELGRTYLRLSDPRHALEALERGRNIRMTPEFFEEMSAAHRMMGDARQAAISLIEGVTAGATDTADNRKLAAELVALYRETEPQSCAVVDSGGAPNVNLECPLVREEVCMAARNMARVYTQTGHGTEAEQTKKGAIGGMGCAAELFE
jgi:protein O-mannosyl-transferase